MVGGGLLLALIPSPLIVAAIAVFGLSPARTRLARALGVGGVVLALALLAGAAVVVATGGRVEASFGTPIDGVGFLLRVDTPGLILALAAAAAALLLLIDACRRVSEVGALLTCVIGSVVAALAGNAVVLFAGLEIANVGMLLVLSASRGRPGRGGLAAVAIQHLASLGLLAAAVQLEGSIGTTDFAVIPAGAIGAAIAGPWAAAGAVRLISVGFTPARGVPATTAAWASTAAIPCGAIALLRLREASAGAIPQQITVGLAVAGGVVAIMGALAASRRPAATTRTGRALCLVAAGPVIAMSGLSGVVPGTAMAAAICALVLCCALTPAWERAALGRTSAVTGAVALVAAGGLPVGFGTTAVILELSAALSLGRAGAPLLAALGIAAFVAAAASVRAALALTDRAEGRAGRPRALGGVAVCLSVVAATAPGAVAATVLSALGGGGGAIAVGWTAVRTAGGDWAGGYLVFAIAVFLAGAWSLATLAAIPTPPLRPRRVTARPGAEPLPLPLRAARAVRPGLLRGSRAADRVDTWLLVQPQLPLVIIGALVAILLIH